ncbi:MAG TPA: GTP 3',8-cyclase MoaA [Acidimicrobiales bacterium]|nr:GTP 3',8-cyclase MoaA [Acidimicrobiales bacterium]
MAAPSPADLVDSFGRTVRDLRVSVTDRCNFRCTYCMPAEGMQWLDRTDVLSFDEIERVARVCVERFGFDAVRITGGEPTMRAHLPALVRRLSTLGAEVSMTTNGATLAHAAHDLAAAGLARVNVSIDSLRPDRFAAITGRPSLDTVLHGITAAVDAGLAPVKLNVVLVRGVNDDEALDFATFGRTHGLQVRFIEFMPLDAQGAWDRSSVVPADETVAAIDAVYPLEAVARHGAPAALWRYRDGRGEIGAIASVTKPFCGDCDRVRMTAEGMFRNCLFALHETDLRTLLRGGADDDALAAAIAGDVSRKWEGHHIGRVDFIRPGRSMSQIGG